MVVALTEPQLQGHSGQEALVAVLSAVALTEHLPSSLQSMISVAAGEPELSLSTSLITLHRTDTGFESTSGSPVSGISLPGCFSVS